MAGYKDTYTTIHNILKGKRTVKKVNISGDKVVRAGKMELLFEAGNVHMIRGWWNEETIKELREFPNGTHADKVDAISGAFIMAKSSGGTQAKSMSTSNGRWD